MKPVTGQERVPVSQGAVRRNLPWTESEDQALLEAWQDGQTKAQLSEAHGRSLGAISSRLLHLGLVARTAKFSR